MDNSPQVHEIVEPYFFRVSFLSPPPRDSLSEWLSRPFKRLLLELLRLLPSSALWVLLGTVKPATSPYLSGRVSDSRPAKLRRGDRSFLRARPLPSFRISPNIRNSLKHTHHRPQTSYAFGKLLRQGTIHNLYEFRLKRKLIQSAAFGYKTL